MPPQSEALLGHLLNKDKSLSEHGIQPGHAAYLFSYRQLSAATSPSRLDSLQAKGSPLSGEVAHTYKELFPGGTTDAQGLKHHPAEEQPPLPFPRNGPRSEGPTTLSPVSEPSHPCSVHGKNRAMSSLIDDGEGGYRCKVGIECKSYAATYGYSQHRVCSIHGKRRSYAVLTDDGIGGFRCIPGRECKGAVIANATPAAASAKAGANFRVAPSTGTAT